MSAMNTTEPSNVEPAFDSDTFRQVLGHFPTGVVVITARGTDGNPAGMAVGSFTSVSLDPPLVAFLPDKSSSSFPKIRAAGSFCVNVLAGDQEPVCRAFAARGVDRFAGLHWHPAASGAPILDGVVAWIDCDIQDIHEAGDHYIVLGRVRDLEVAAPSMPLLFFRGGYGKFNAPSRSAPAGDDLLDPLRLVDVARPSMERLSADSDVECLATALVGDEIVFVGSSGRPSDEGISTRVGLRMPFMAPLATPLIAWEPADRLRAWIDRLGPSVTAEEVATYQELAARTREQGFSLVVASPAQLEVETVLAHAWHDPGEEYASEMREAVRHVGATGHEPARLSADELYDVRYLSAPVFGADGRVVLMLTLYSLPARCSVSQIDTFRERLLGATGAVSEALRHQR